MYDLIKENELILNFGAKIKSSALRIAKFSDRKIGKKFQILNKTFLKFKILSLKILKTLTDQPLKKDF